MSILSLLTQCSSAELRTPTREKAHQEQTDYR